MHVTIIICGTCWRGCFSFLNPDVHDQRWTQGSAQLAKPQAVILGLNGLANNWPICTFLWTLEPLTKVWPYGPVNGSNNVLYVVVLFGVTNSGNLLPYRYPDINEGHTYLCTY